MSSKYAPPRRNAIICKKFLATPQNAGISDSEFPFPGGTFAAKSGLERARTIVEYGPGVGTITAHILARMSPRTRLVVFEMNEDFVQYLNRAFPDPRLHVVHGSAENVQRELDRLKLDGADYIISGIPFTTMPVALREKIMRESREAIRPGGAVLVYQFTRAVLPYLRSHFDQIDQDFEPRNILPARVFY